MIREFKATISYTTDKEHPETCKKEKHTFSDTYKVNDNCFFGYDDIMLYIKRDLSLIAGGGYNTKHIHNVEFEIHEI